MGLIISTEKASAQQDAQFTQYMFNQLAYNPAYAGSRETLSLIGLHRTQWVGLEGAPRSLTFSAHSPIGESEKVGLGINVLRDEIFVTDETYIDASFSYRIDVSDTAKLAFGVSGGIQMLNVDLSRTSAFQGGDILTANANIDNRIVPQVGAGIFYNTNKFYFGFSVPNLINTEHFDLSNNSDNATTVSVATERFHYFFSTGYVFDLSDKVKFKPAALVKVVNGAPIGADLSASFLFNEKFRLGAAYRLDAAISAMAGFQLTKDLLIGLAYDRETTELQQFNSGSYEFFLRYEVPRLSKKKLIAPRFF